MKPGGGKNSPYKASKGGSRGRNRKITKILDDQTPPLERGNKTEKKRRVSKKKRE